MMRVTKLACLVLLAFSACRPPEPRPQAGRELALVAPAEVATPPFFPAATWLTATQDPSVLNLDGLVLVILDAASLPLAWWEKVLEHYASANTVVLCGLGPLGTDLVFDGQRMSFRSHEVTNLLRAARASAAFPPVMDWAQEGATGELQGSVFLAPSGEVPWPAVSVHIRQCSDWEGLVGNVKSGRMLAADKALCFYARGGPRTSRILMEGRERDGSRWIARLTVGEVWTPFVLPEKAFEYREGGAGRGGPDDSLRLKNLESIFVGLRRSDIPCMPGEHRFGISEIRLAPEEAVAAFFRKTSPTLPFVGAFSAISKAARLQDSDRVWTESVPALPVDCGDPTALPRAGTWIALWSAENSAGEFLGWPVMLHRWEQPDGSLLQCGRIGLDGSRTPLRLMEKAIADVVARFRQPLLKGSGSPQLTFKASDPLRPRATVSAPVGAPAVRLVGELLDSAGRVLRRTTVLDLEPARVYRLNLGRTAAPANVVEDLELRLALETAAAPIRTVDAVRQPLRLIRIEPRDAPPLRPSGGRFLARRAAIALNGFVYAPPVHPSSAAGFLPEGVRRDLLRMQRAGFNTLWLKAGQGKPNEALKFVMAEAAAQNLWVLLMAPEMHESIEPLDKLANEIGLDFPSLLGVVVSEPPGSATEGTRHPVGRARRWLAQRAPHLLVGALYALPSETGWRRTDFEGAPHADFVVLHISGPPPTETAWPDALFSTEIVRWLSGGKPVIWLGEAWEIHETAQSADLAQQAEWAQDFARMLSKAQAAGFIFSSFSGKSYGSDRGAIGPEGTWRPHGRILRATALRLRQEQSDPIKISRPVDLPLRFDAEWGSLELGDATMVAWDPKDARMRVGTWLRATLVNTGNADWPQGTEVRATSELGAESLRIPPLRVAEQTTVGWRPQWAGTWSLRVIHPTEGEIGQPLRVTVYSSFDR